MCAIFAGILMLTKGLRKFSLISSTDTEIIFCCFWGQVLCLQCFDAVGWVAGRAFSL